MTSILPVFDKLIYHLMGLIYAFHWIAGGCIFLVSAAVVILSIRGQFQFHFGQAAAGLILSPLLVPFVGVEFVASHIHAPIGHVFAPWITEIIWDGTPFLPFIAAFA